MSSHYPPLTYKQVAHGLKQLGFVPRPQKATSHEHWVATIDGIFRKVTVDMHIQPFSGMLLRSMIQQSGVGKKEFFAACLGRLTFKLVLSSTMQFGGPNTPAKLAS